mmetsp:Transcript_19368/g.68545  ORF Transcript_19368/g.68545 Transcript_19368/m.68545 type:complete len:229 (+) Transcript_19368:2048-2734(+)
MRRNEPRRRVAAAWWGAWPCARARSALWTVLRHIHASPPAARSPPRRRRGDQLHHPLQHEVAEMQRVLLLVLRCEAAARAVHLQDPLAVVDGRVDGVDGDDVHASEAIARLVHPPPVLRRQLQLLHHARARVRLPVAAHTRALVGSVVAADLLDAQVVRALHVNLRGHVHRRQRDHALQVAERVVVRQPALAEPSVRVAHLGHDRVRGRDAHRPVVGIVRLRKHREGG